MKQIAIISIICLLLTACGNSTSIGVIGGADGPTSIIVGKENSDSVKEPLRMIKVDGKLYYDSGLESKNSPRCGTMDGELKQVGEEYEIPKNDNECNFQGAEGYQNATNITKEISIDGKWIIFKMFDDPELDMDVFKYCFYLKGSLPNAANDSEIAVLTEDANYTFEDHSEMFSSMAGSYSGSGNTGKHFRQTTFRSLKTGDKWGLSLSAKDVTSSGLTILFEQFGGSPTGELQTGESYSLEVLKNDEWETVNYTRLVNLAWQSTAYGIDKNSITELKVDWEWLYGKLPSGDYRLKKEITDFRGTGDFDKETYDLYFTIE